MPIVYTLLSNLFCMLIWVCCKRLMKHLIKKSKHKIQKRTSLMGCLLLIEFVARNKWRQARIACFNRYSASGALSWPISSPKISLDCPGLNTINKQQKQIQILKQKQIQILKKQKAKSNTNKKQKQIQVLKKKYLNKSKYRYKFKNQYNYK